MKIQTINELNTYFDPGVGHAKGRGKKILNRSEMIICTDDNIQEIVTQEIERFGNKADLNHLDVSRVTDMSHLFYSSNFNGDISQWNTSKVTNMDSMFAYSEFNQDISQWDVSNVIYMGYMFRESKFNGDISSWNVSNVEYMQWMFYGSSKFNQDISKWNINNVKDMSGIFCDSKFNQNISNWKINHRCGCRYIFSNCPIHPKYKPQLPTK